jgi:hypothetical protein
MKEWHIPNTVSDNKSILSSMNLYMKFIRRYLHITRPLNQLTNQKTLIWSLQEDKTFHMLKEATCYVHVLALPDLQYPFKIETDPSQYATGIVLKARQVPSCIPF